MTLIDEVEPFILKTNPEDFDYSPIEEIEEWFLKRIKDVLPEIKKLKAAGYNPIAYSVMMVEDTFVFETDEESVKAYQEFEENATGRNKISGWWYGKKDFFEKVLPDYREDMKKHNETLHPYVLLNQENF